MVPTYHSLTTDSFSSSEVASDSVSARATTTTVPKDPQYSVVDGYFVFPGGHKRWSLEELAAKFEEEWERDTGGWAEDDAFRQGLYDVFKKVFKPVRIEIGKLEDDVIGFNGELVESIERLYIWKKYILRESHREPSLMRIEALRDTMTDFAKYDKVYSDAFDRYRKESHGERWGDETLHVESLAEAFRRAKKFESGKLKDKRDFRPIRIRSVGRLHKSRGWRRLSDEEVGALRRVESALLGRVQAARATARGRRQLEKLKTQRRAGFREGDDDLAAMIADALTAERDSPRRSRTHAERRVRTERLELKKTQEFLLSITTRSRPAQIARDYGDSGKRIVRFLMDYVALANAPYTGRWLLSPESFRDKWGMTFDHASRIIPLLPLRAIRAEIAWKVRPEKSPLGELVQSAASLTYRLTGLQERQNRVREIGAKAAAKEWAVKQRDAERLLSKSWGKLSYAYGDVAEALLIMSGIEKNPGPAASVLISALAAAEEQDAVATVFDSKSTLGPAVLVDAYHHASATGQKLEDVLKRRMHDIAKLCRQAHVLMQCQTSVAKGLEAVAVAAECLRTKHPRLSRVPATEISAVQSRWNTCDTLDEICAPLAGMVDPPECTPILTRALAQVVAATGHDPEGAFKELTMFKMSAKWRPWELVIESVALLRDDKIRPEHLVAVADDAAFDKDLEEWWVTMEHRPESVPRYRMFLMFLLHHPGSPIVSASTMKLSRRMWDLAAPTGGLTYALFEALVSQASAKYRVPRVEADCPPSLGDDEESTSTAPETGSARPGTDTVCAGSASTASTTHTPPAVPSSSTSATTPSESPDSSQKDGVSDDESDTEPESDDDGESEDESGPEEPKFVLPTSSKGGHLDLDEYDEERETTEYLAGVARDYPGSGRQIDDLVRGRAVRYIFRGKYDTTGDCSFDTTDPEVSVTYLGGIARFCWAGETNRVYIPPKMIEMAAGCVASSSPYARYLSILSKWTRSDANLGEIKEHCHPEELRLNALRAFFLAGVLSSCVGSNGAVCEYVQIDTYRVKDPQDRWVNEHVKFFDNKALFKEKWPRTFRLGYYHMDGLVAHLADATDDATIKAGIKKRLHPDLPRRTRAMTEEILRRTDQMIEVCESWLAQHPLFWNEAEELENFLRGRPKHESDIILAGYEWAKRTPEDALDAYLTCRYKCFVKLESYTLFANKPNRFIMTLPPEMRGVQFFFMGRILGLIERATSEGNVKHLTPQETLEKLKRKFGDVAFAYETDFSSFESCLQPELKNIIENRLFRKLANTVECEFIDKALIRRKTLTVVGPTFVIRNMPHIRMSGDLWTSIGNLVSNVVINAAIGEIDVERLLHEGLFEGDDGIFPAHLDEDTYNRRAADAGVLLKVVRGRWEELSFCGNNMCDFNGTLMRTRDPVRVVQGLSTIFNADQQTRKQDRMLQRSKAISVLSNSWVPGASVFAACIEWCTRDTRVSEAYLRRHGLLKEWQPYSLESCLPADLCTQHKEDFCRIVACRDVAAGGTATAGMVRKTLDCMERDGSCPNYLGIQDKTALRYVDGTRFSWGDFFRDKEHLKRVWGTQVDRALRQGGYAARRVRNNYARGKPHDYRGMLMSSLVGALAFFTTLLADPLHWRESFVAAIPNMVLQCFVWLHAFMVRSGRWPAFWTVGGRAESLFTYGCTVLTSFAKRAAYWLVVRNRPPDVAACPPGLGGSACARVLAEYPGAHDACETNIWCDMPELEAHPEWLAEREDGAVWFGHLRRGTVLQRLRRFIVF